LSFWPKTNIGQPGTKLFQQLLTISMQSWWAVHIFKNLKEEENWEGSVEKSNRRGKWSELFLVRVETLTELHTLIHAWLQITLSSLLWVYCLPLLPFVQVKKAPWVGKWIRFKLLVQFWKSEIGVEIGTQMLTN
jgi:hypothetical protein